MGVADVDKLTPWWTLCGVWPQSGERWCDYYQAVTPELAEDMAQAEAAAKGGVLWVSTVFAGRLKSVDSVYAKYVDRSAIDEDELYGF